VLFVAALALAFVSFMPQPVYALAPSDVATPPAPTGERLERVWAHEQEIYERLGNFLDKAGARIEKAQGLIDRARANGRDVTALQAALDDLADSVKRVRPVYEGGKGIIASHQGFDDAGQATDFEKALATVRQMGSKLREIRQTLLPSLRSLRDAVREFRQANRAIPTATPSGA
jgi:hypothetical protein